MPPLPDYSEKQRGCLPFFPTSAQYCETSQWAAAECDDAGGSWIRDGKNVVTVSPNYRIHIPIVPSRPGGYFFAHNFCEIFPAAHPIPGQATICAKRIDCLAETAANPSIQPLGVSPYIDNSCLLSMKAGAGHSPSFVRLPIKDSRGRKMAMKPAFFRSASC